jgi:hypothetical protein
MSLEAPPAARRHSGMPPSNDQPHREFYSLHYIESWGPLKCVDHELYSLPDVVRVVMSAQGLPHIDAAKVVLRRVLDNPAARCYVTRPGSFAIQLRRPASAPHPVVKSTPGAKAKGKSPQLRSRPLKNGGLLVEMNGALICELPAVLNAYFHSLQCVARAGGFSDEDLYVPIDGGQLAIHAEDTEAAFDFEWFAVFGLANDEQSSGSVSAESEPIRLGAAPTGEQAATSDTAAEAFGPTVAAEAGSVLALVRPLPKLIKPDMAPMKKPGTNWTDSQRKRVLDQHNWLTHADGGGFKKEQADEELAAIWNVSASNIKQARLKAAKLLKAASLDMGLLANASTVR